MIITIGRQHGSNGHLIARAVAEELGLPCYDKEIVDRAAADSPYTREIVESFDEKSVSPYFGAVTPVLGMGESFRLNMQVASAQFEAIRKLAADGSGVFVGRCADYVLRQREDLLRVFIRADQDFRVRTVMERRALTEEQARKLVRQVDKDRASYYRYYSDQGWGEAANFDLCINSAKTGVEGAVRVIVAAVRALDEG